MVVIVLIDSQQSELISLAIIILINVPRTIVYRGWINNNYYCQSCFDCVSKVTKTALLPITPFRIINNINGHKENENQARLVIMMMIAWTLMIRIILTT